MGPGTEGKLALMFGASGVLSAANAQSLAAGRHGPLKKFADVVTFLCSDRGPYVTGSKIRIDGGNIKSIQVNPKLT